MENSGVSPGHTPLGSQSPVLTRHPSLHLGSQSPVLTLHHSLHQGQRRESFLYRSDSDYDMSPKTLSRNSATSEG